MINKEVVEPRNNIKNKQNSVIKHLYYKIGFYCKINRGTDKMLKSKIRTIRIVQYLTNVLNILRFIAKIRPTYVQKDTQS